MCVGSWGLQKALLGGDSSSRGAQDEAPWVQIYSQNSHWKGSAKQRKMLKALVLNVLSFNHLSQ